MNTLPVHLREDLLNYIPPYILEETSCFVFADKHPTGKKTADITVCTYTLPGSASVKQFSQREIMSSLMLNCTSKPTQITSSRNRNCDLFYVISAGDELFILNGENLEVMRKICNVMVFDVAYNMSSGEGTLRVMSTDHVNALEFDDSFNIVEETLEPDPKVASHCPAMTNLQRKLTAARYNVTHNESLIEDYRKLRCSAAFKMLQEMHPGLSESVFKSGLNQIAADLRINIQSQWMKTFNNKLLIVLDLNNEADVPLESINILIQEHNIPTMVYKTKIFEETSTAPYWNELTTKSVLKQNRPTSVVTLIDVKELNNNVTSQIEFNALLLYKIGEKEKYLPLEQTKLTARDIQGESFNLLCCSLDKKEMLAILAASIKTDLIIQQIESTKVFNLQDLLKKGGLEKVASCDNVLVYRKSPYDVLNGVMVVINEHLREGRTKVSVYTRKESQVLYLINLLQDITEKRLVITTKNHRMEAKRPELSQYNQIPTESNKQIDIEKYAKSLLRQVNITKEYYEDCMAKMHESNDENVLNNIGKAVDIFACGKNTFEEFKVELTKEISQGIDVIIETFTESNKDEVMIVESEEF